jgi:multidrug efflux system outer membrane protein
MLTHAHARHHTAPALLPPSHRHPNRLRLPLRFLPPSTLAAALPLAAAFALLAGCAVGPDYQRPAPSEPTPTAFADPGPWKNAIAKSRLPKARWWSAYEDPVLDQLVTQAFDGDEKSVAAGKGNPSILAAIARVEEARALAGVERSALFPTLDGTASAARSRTERNRATGASAYTRNNFALGFDLRYEVDLWGRVRRLAEAADARAAASEADYHDVVLLIQSSVASAYFDLRALDAERELVRLNVVSLGKSLDIARRRKARGAGDSLELALAEAEVHTSKSDLHEIDRLRARRRNELAVLCGRNPSTFTLAEDPRAALLAPPEIPTGLPSEILKRRPDIAAAERELAATSADIGVAKAAFYPSVTLFGDAGFASVDFDKTLDWGSRYWSLAPTLTLPVFEGGRNNANLRRAEARHLAALAAYRAAVLAAFQEVETCLGDLRLLAKRAVDLERAVAASARAAKLVATRHERGAVGYLDVTQAEREAISNKRLAVQLRGRQLATSVLLVKAIGGGWDGETAAAPAASAAVAAPAAAK